MRYSLVREDPEEDPDEDDEEELPELELEETEELEESPLVLAVGVVPEVEL